MEEDYEAYLPSVMSSISLSYQVFVLFADNALKILTIATGYVENFMLYSRQK